MSENNTQKASSVRRLVRRYSRSDSACFEGQWWHWTHRIFAPVQMVHGTVQMHCTDLSAALAWEKFARVTGKTRSELMADGYRVKAIVLVPGWKPKTPNND